MCRSRPAALTATLAGALVASALTLYGAQAGVRTTPPEGPRTGVIVGQVVDAGTGKPVGDAIVRLVLQGYADDVPGSPNERVMADGEGRFVFSGLPPGRYYLEAGKEGHTRGEYGQREPWGQSQRVQLGEGERRIGVELPVWKYAVIGGRVVDEAGEPVVGVAVRALVRDVFAGRTQYGNRQVIPELVPIAVTDDRGMFRLSQLSPGTYVVLVPSTHTTVPASALLNPGAALRTELFWGGVQEMTALGQPRAIQVGDFALMSLNRVLIPPPPAPDGRMQVYQTTFYPAEDGAGAATAITVRSGEERTDLTISMTPVPAVRISGRLITPDGSVPPPTMLRLDGAATADVITAGSPTGPDYVGLETATALSDGSGRFSMLGVPPGSYIIRQGNRFLDRPLRQGNPSYWVSQPLSVGARDVEDLTIELRHALLIKGRFELRGRSPAPVLIGIGFETPYGEPGRAFAEVDRKTLTFSTAATGGRYIAQPYEMGGWFVESVTLDGKDITDRPFDLQSNATVLVTYTDRPSPVSGMVTDEEGRAVPGATVIVFSADRQRWSGYGDRPRTLRSVLPNDDSVYTIEHLPPGDYYVIAVDASGVSGWRNPERLEAFTAHATRLSVAAGDPPKTVDLRVRPVR
jgi:protocatechuate 3,4-dioxygenase beta subunit